MTVETYHPYLTTARRQDYERCEASIAGRSEIKKEMQTYLPMPSGFKGMDDGGVANYEIYIGRAQFPEFMAPTVSAIVGIIHGDGIVIELPDGLEYLREKATESELTLDDFHRQITSRLTGIGRYGVLVDAPDDGGDPYLLGIDGQKVINWDEDFYVIDQSGYVRGGFNWEKEKSYLVLELDGTRYVQTRYTGESLAGEEIDVRGVGARVLNEIPFHIANAVDVVPDIISPPLIGVADAAISNYQLSADHRWQLYMSGQETLFVINGEAPTTVGAGVLIGLQGSPDLTPDAKYVSPSCSGIEAHERAIELGKQSAAHAGARLWLSEDSGQESGYARSLRMKSETASILTIANTSCSLLERALKSAAIMTGANPDDVIVTPPKSLMDQTMTPTELAALWGVVEAGGLSHQTFYDRAQEGGQADSERTFEEELAMIDAQPEGEPDSVV